jgi:hypothetical protein
MPPLKSYFQLETTTTPKMDTTTSRVLLVINDSNFLDVLFWIKVLVSFVCLLILMDVSWFLKLAIKNIKKYKREKKKKDPEAQLKNEYPIINECELAITLKILECLNKFVSGVISTLVPELFRQQFKLSLPDNWLTIIGIIGNFPKYFNVEDGQTQYTFHILPNCNSTTPTAPALSSVENNQSPLAKLELPWNEKKWNLCFTNPVKTDEVWACLIGPEYSDLLRTLLNDIKKSIMTHKTHPISILIGDICLVCVSEYWSRVRIIKISTDKRDYKCFNIDQGSSHWYEIENIYVCESRFVDN